VILAVPSCKELESPLVFKHHVMETYTVGMVVNLHAFQANGSQHFPVQEPVKQQWSFPRTYTALVSHCTRMYPEVSGLTAWSENCKRYSFLPLGAVVSLFRESV
jgi:hypothetical protein